MHDERRATYRMAPEQSDRLKLILSSAPGTPMAQEIVDITTHGAGTRFPKAEPPTLAVGERVKLRFSSPNLPRNVDVSATVASRTEIEEQHHYSFKFERHIHLDRELPEAFYRMFNRRGAYRVAAFDASSGVEVGLQALDSAPKKITATGRLKNISATGLGALVDAISDREFDAVSSVKTTLRLPNSDRLLTLIAWIRNRESINGQVYYGLRFDPAQTKDYLDQEEEIVDYVLCEYQAKLGSTLH